MRKLVCVYAAALLACILLTAVHGDALTPGLSITMGMTISAIYSTMLGSISTTLSSTMILTSEEPYRQALGINQIILPLIASVVLCFVELARSSYGSVPHRLERASENLMSEAALLAVLCLVFLIVAFYYQIMGVFW